MLSRLSQHRSEIIGGIILLLLSAFLPNFGLSNDTAWLVGILSVLLPLTAATIKSHITNISKELIEQRINGPDKASQIGSILSELDGISFQYASEEVTNVLSRITSIKIGEIPLNTPTYFHLIIKCMKEAPRDSFVYAVNCIDELRWNNDPRENAYLQANHEARQKGVKINRIFILDKEKINTDNTKQRLGIVKEQVESENIETKIVWKTDLIGQEHRIKDWVLFEKPNRQLYIDYADPVDPIRVSHAVLLINKNTQRQYLEDFQILSEASISDDVFLKMLL